MKTILSLVASIFILSACKTGWTVQERNDFISSCAQVAAKMGQEKATAYCTCMQQKLEAKYPNSDEAGKAVNAPGAMQTPELSAMAQACLTGNTTNENNNNNGGGIIGGGGGNNNNQAVAWTADDQQKFMTTCVQNAMNAGADKQTSTEHCNCTLQKIAAKYANYDEASNKLTKDEIGAMEKECNENNNKIGNNNNNNPGGVIDGGNNNNRAAAWTAADQQKFMKTCLQNALNAGADQQTSNAHCSCTLQKIAAKYASYDEANNKMTSEEVNAMEQQCIQERNGAGGKNANEENENNN